MSHPTTVDTIVSTPFNEREQRQSGLPLHHKALPGPFWLARCKQTNLLLILDLLQSLVCLLHPFPQGKLLRRFVVTELQHQPPSSQSLV